MLQNLLNPEKLDVVLIYKSNFFKTWVWRLQTWRKDVLCGSSEMFESKLKAKKNIERVTGGKIEGLKKWRFGADEANDVYYRGFLRRS